ncbi:MAG: septal ring lytic transglycosylase RlpA family protein [Calothrix sp. C42_A2020_038]|nr:septal ring lytic transglycosylase RlpA family protein [Calothrix sp. C42_A2020_038]
MNHRHLLTVVVLLSAIVGTPSIGRSQTTKQTVPANPSLASGEVMKVGEYQNQASNAVAAAVTQIHTHNLAGKQAATLYIRDIPVLTFVGQQQGVSTETKVGAIGDTGRRQSYVATASSQSTVELDDQVNSNDPVQRASLVATRINELVQQKVDADKIRVSWQAVDVDPTAQNKSLSNTESGRYVIKVDDHELVAFDNNTLAPDATSNRAADALQATNRLRRLVGNAAPISEIANYPTKLPSISIPKLPNEIAEPIKVTLRGIASFYGYDGSGNRTATGERFNPEGMTAAHRSLPFGTRVRVTNTRNGRSVVVRINDRGPFIRGRVIDLSYGAARVLGMIGKGLAPVKIEVLGR